jgi:hypothetical protein
MSIYQGPLEDLQNEGFANLRQSFFRRRLHLPCPKRSWIYHRDLGRPTVLVFPSLIKVRAKMDLHAELNSKVHTQGRPTFSKTKAFTKLQLVSIVDHRVHVPPMIFAVSAGVVRGFVR